MARLLIPFLAIILTKALLANSSLLDTTKYIKANVNENSTLSSNQTGSGQRPNFVPVAYSGDSHGGEKGFQLVNSETFLFGLNRHQASANFTVHALNDSVKLLYTGRFPALLKNTQCTENNVTFNFSGKSDFKEAQSHWHWVNNQQKNSLVLITTQADCDQGHDDPDHIQPWEVTKATFQENQTTVVFDAEPRAYKDVFKDWSFKASSKPFDSAAGGSNATHKRDTSGTIGLTTNFSGIGIPFGEGIEGAVTDSNGSLGAITCDPCYTHGNLDFDIDVQPNPLSNDFGGKITFTAREVGASLTANLAFWEKLEPPANFTQKIFSWVPPYCGVQIPGLVDIGLTVVVDMVMSLGSNSDNLGLSAGINMSIPDGSFAELDTLHPENNQLHGWTPRFDPLPPGMTDKIDIEGKIGPQLRMELSGDIVTFHGEAGFTWADPELEVKVKGIDKAPACGKKNATMGLDFDIGLQDTLFAFAGEELQGVESASAAKTFVSTSIQLLSTCQPLDHVTKITRPLSMPTPQISGFTPNVQAQAVAGVAQTVIGGIESLIPAASSEFGVVTSHIVGEATSIASDAVSEATVVASSAVNEATIVATAAVSEATVVATAATSEAAVITSDVVQAATTALNAVTSVGNDITSAGKGILSDIGNIFEIRR